VASAVRSRASYRFDVDDSLVALANEASAKKNQEFNNSIWKKNGDRASKHSESKRSLGSLFKVDQ
jgi:hypothetical protein